MFNKRLLREFKDNNILVVFMVLCQLLSLAANIIFTYFTADLLYGMYKNEINSDLVIRYIIIVIFVLIVRMAANTKAQNLSFKASWNVKTRLRKLIYDKLLNTGSRYREYITTSEAVQISTEGVEQLEIYFGKYIPQFFYSMLAPVILFVVVGTMSIKTAVVLLVCVPLIPVSIVAVQKFAKKLLAKYWGTYTQMGDNFLESLQGLTTLKIYNADEKYAVKMDEEAERFRKITMRVLIMQLNSISVMDLVAYGGAAAGIIMSILELKAGNINFGQCFFIIMISAEFFLPLRLLGSFFHIAMNGNAAADKIFKFIDTDISKEEKTDVINGDKIEFKNVTFSYDGNKNVLDGVDFSIKERSFTSIVGVSGCGKSTIASLIMGENSGYNGEVFIGQSDNRYIKESVRYKKITRVSHNSYLFKGTLRENLLMANENLSDNEMIKALKIVDLYDLAMENGGLDMQILERASNISGGQKQRVAIARAILADSDIYIFDEAASNVDVESENKIMEVITELSRNKTVILISHRLANVVNSDEILVMKDGKIIESGRHAKLMDNDDYYKSLFVKQKELESYAGEVL